MAEIEDNAVRNFERPKLILTGNYLNQRHTNEYGTVIFGEKNDLSLMTFSNQRISLQEKFT